MLSLVPKLLFQAVICSEMIQGTVNRILTFGINCLVALVTNRMLLSS